MTHEGKPVTQDNREPTLVALGLFLFRHVRLLAGATVGMFLLAFTFFLLRGSYTAESQFEVRQSGLTAGTLAGFARQFGFNLPTGDLGDLSGESVDFYAALLQSSGLLAQVAQSEVRFSRQPRGEDWAGGALMDVLGIEGDTPNDRLLSAVKHLATRVSVATDLRSGLVTLRVKMPYPHLAQVVNRRLLSLVDSVNAGQRRYQAAAERRFIEQRMAAAHRELAEAEEAMQSFLETNRTYQQSPRLAFESARLQRQIDLRQQVYLLLAQAYERARIEEVRNTPVIAVITDPETMWRRTHSPAAMGLVGALAGLGLAMAWSLLREYLAEERRRHTTEYDELRRKARAVVPLRRHA